MFGPSAALVEEDEGEEGEESAVQPLKSVDEAEDNKETEDEDDDDEHKASVDVSKPVPAPQEEPSGQKSQGLHIQGHIVHSVERQGLCSVFQCVPA